MKQNLFDVSADLASCKISTPNFEFLPESLLEIEIKWNFKELMSEAIFTVNEKSDLLNSFKNFKPEDNEITFYIEEKRVNKETKKPFILNKKYIITQISEVKDEESGNKSHQITCIDNVSYLLKNTFLSKGYKNIKLSNIINDIFTMYKIKDMINVDIKINDSKEDPKNLVIPGHLSLYDFIMYQANQEGYVLYQDNLGLYGKHITELYKQNLNKIDTNKTFIQGDQNSFNEFKITEVIGEFFSSHDNLEFPRTITYVYDPVNKKILDKQQNFNELYENLNFTNSKESYIQNTVGSYYDIAEVNLSDYSLVKLTYTNYLKNNTLEIILPGTFDNTLLELRDVNIIGSTRVTEGTTKGNETLNGNYLLLTRSDKVLNNKFIQKIELGRINNTDKKDIKG